MYSKFVDKLRIFLVVLAYSLEVMLLCKFEFWCVKISLRVLRKAELGETIPNSIFTNGNNTWLLTKTKSKSNRLYLVRRSAFRRRHARLPAFVGCILNFRRNWEYSQCCWYTIDLTWIFACCCILFLTFSKMICEPAFLQIAKVLLILWASTAAIYL